MEQLTHIIRGPVDASGDPTAGAKAAYVNILQDELRANAIRRALFATIRIPDQDVAVQYEKFSGPTTVSLVSFDPSAFLRRRPDRAGRN